MSSIKIIYQTSNLSIIYTCKTSNHKAFDQVSEDIN